MDQGKIWRDLDEKERKNYVFRSVTYIIAVGMCFVPKTELRNRQVRRDNRQSVVCDQYDGFRPDLQP